MNELISIVVPIYNMEKKLRRCLNSLENQTYKNIEVLLINDGSKDKSDLICIEFERKDSRFKYFEKTNGGLSSARNYGISKAKGKYIYFIDSDDYCEPTIISKLCDNFNEDIQISSCGYNIEYPFEKIEIKKNYINIGKMNVHDFVLELEQNDMLNVVWNKLYVLDIIRKNKITFLEMMMPGEDLLFNCMYLKHVSNGLTISDTLYHYMRENEETLVNKYDPNLLTKVENFIDGREELLNQIGVDTRTKDLIMSKTTIQYTFSCLTNLFRKNNFDKFGSKIRSLKKIIELSKYNDAYLKFSTKDRNYKMFLGFIKIDKPIFMFCIYSILFFLRNNFSRLYLSYRKQNLNKISG